MPRGSKSKQRARERRRQDRAETRLKSAQAATVEEEEATSSSSTVCGDDPSSSPVAGDLQASSILPDTTGATAAVSYRRSNVGAKSHVRKSKSLSQASTSSESSGTDLLSQRAGMLVHFLVFQRKIDKPIKKADMLKVVQKRFKFQFSEILGKASATLDLVYGLELKEIKPNSQCYTLVCKQDDTSDESRSSAWQFPTKAILMPLLGVIFLHSNRASEKIIWEFLNMIGVYDGEAHVLFGEPRKLITQDLVKEKYLEYRQVPNTNPPRYEFLWGPRAHAETSKMKVLEFLAKVNETDPSAFPEQYEEALRDEEERARVMAATKPATASKARARSRATSSHYSHPQ